MNSGTELPPIVFLFVRQHGFESADAEDLTQKFFAAWLAKDTFAKADSGLAIDEKQVANALLTARRAYQRLLRDEIRLYARSEDEVSAEVRDIFRAFQR